MRTLPLKADCSCFRARDIKSPDPESVINAILNIVPPGTDFHTMSKTEFRAYYKQATSQMVRESAVYAALTPSEQEELEFFFILRCGGCGLNLLPVIRAASPAGTVIS